MLETIRITNEVYRLINAGCDCYLINCGNEGVMIDCGCTAEDIRQYAQSIIGKPVGSVIITHSHIDHCGKCGLFDQVYMSEVTYRYARNPMDEDPDHLNLSYRPVFISDHDHLKISDHDFEIILCDCHAPGNIMILDHTDRILFTGDEIDKDQVLLLPGFSNDPHQYHSANSAAVAEYRSLLEKIYSRKDEYDILCTGHNGSPLDKNIIASFIDLCTDILNGICGVPDCSSNTYDPSMSHYPYQNAHYLRYTKNELSLVYCFDDLYDRKGNNLISPATPLHVICRNNCK